MTRTKGDLSSSLPRPGDDAMSLHSQPDDVVTGSSRRAFLDDDDDAPELQIDDLPPLYSEVAPADGAQFSQSISHPSSVPLAPSASSVPASSGAASAEDGADSVGPIPEFFGEGQPVRSVVLPANPASALIILSNVEQAICKPPRPFVRLLGTHEESFNRDGKKETQIVTDFDVRVELTPYLYSDARAGKAWVHTRTAPNAKKTYRGTVFKRYAPNYSASGYTMTADDRARKAEFIRRHEERCRDQPRRQLRPQRPPRPSYSDADGDVEAQSLINNEDSEAYSEDENEEEETTFRVTVPPRLTLEQWCERFCKDRSRLRVFTLKREVAGLATDTLRKQLELLVRRTNYRGHLSITFPTNDTTLEIYNDHWMNRWRNVKWIRVLFALTLMFLFAWPFLRFTTKRYEVVTSTWSYSRDRYVENSENNNTNSGDNGTDDVKKGASKKSSSVGSNENNGGSSSAATNAAVDGDNEEPRMTCRHEYASISEDQFYNLWGRAINKAVLEKRQKLLDQEDLRAAEGAEETFQSGNATVDSAVGFVQASINAMNHVNRQLGWGADSC